MESGKRRHFFSALIAIAGAVLLWAGLVLAATNISSDSAEHWAWNDAIGWINFYETDTVNVESLKLTGYASSSAGDISLDCATTRIGNICGTSDYKVVNDGLGNLSGYAWNDTYGWISFWCNNHGGCDQSTYRVFVDSDNGFFCGSGGSATCYAWNDLIGWINFNCANNNSCASSNYKVRTTWVATSTSGSLVSATFDTGAENGVQLNSFIWQGDLPSGTKAEFQFAVSNSSSGPWTYIGPDGTGNTAYEANPGASRSLDYTFFNNYRYFRYKIILTSNQAQTATPRVDSVHVNWSP